VAFSKLGSRSENGESNEDLAEINIIPLVDVMLVLLIIFMVAAPLSITGIKVHLPSSQAKGTQVEENRIVLSINSQGEYFFETMQVPTALLEERMKTIYQNRDSKELFIRADRRVQYGQVIYAMSAAKLAGVVKMAMLTTNEGKSLPN
jgi:biopolymer transport protein TolR